MRLILSLWIGLGMFFTCTNSCLPSHPAKTTSTEEVDSTGNSEYAVSDKNELTPGQGVGGRKLLVWAEPSLRKVSPLQPGRKTTPIWKKNTLHLSLARNEWESFQIVMKSLGKTRRITPHLISLRGPEGKKLSPRRFQMFQARYVTLQSPSDSLGASGRYPDALLPLDKSLEVGKTENTILWITCKTQGEEKPGTYRLRLDLKEGNRKIASLPLEIEVWDIHLPQEPTLKSYYLLETPWMIYQFHRPQSSAKYNQLLRRYADFLLDYRMYPGNLNHLDSVEVKYQNGRISLDLTEMDQWLKHALEKKKAGVFRLPFPLKKISKLAPYQSPKFEKISRQVLAKLYNHYRRKGWHKRHFLFVDTVKNYTHSEGISDEPFNSGKDGYDEMRYWSKLIHSAHKDLNFMVATPPYLPGGWGKVEGYVDTYNYYTNEVDRFSKRTQELIKKGRQVFLVPNSYCDYVDYPGIFHRGLGFFCYKRNLSGIEMWDVMAWYAYPGFEKPDPLQGKLPIRWGPGAGVLLYPGSAWGKEYPISSLRLELNRDGIEDYEYLHQLARLSSREYARQVATALIPLWYQELNRRGDFRFYRLRKFIAQEIIRLRKGGRLHRQYTGRVLDKKGQPVAGVTVMGKYFATETDHRGRYKIYAPSSERKVLVKSLLYRESRGRAGSTIRLVERDSDLLFSFESQEDCEVDYEGGEGSKKGARQVSKYATHGKKSLHLYLPQNAETELGFSSFQPANWKDYKYLAFDAYNPGQNVITLEVGVLDGRKKYRLNDINVYAYGQRLVLPPGERKTLLLSLRSLKLGGYMGFARRPALDLSQVSWFAISKNNAKGKGQSEEIYIDRVRLVK